VGRRKGKNKIPCLSYALHFVSLCFGIRRFFSPLLFRPPPVKTSTKLFCCVFFFCGAKRPNYKQLKIEVHMVIKQKMALMLIHRLLVKKGYFLLAQAVLQHLAGIQKHWSDVNFLLRQFHFSNLI
jgi:hypothetical protein